MSYDIPDEIKYKEKILFGLDFKQLGYLSIFGVAALLAYNLPFQGDLKLYLPGFILFTGVGFVFLKLEDHFWAGYSFFTGVRKAGPQDASAQKLVGIQAVKDYYVQLSDGGLRSILRVEPINFGLLDETQRKGLVLGYREFLNHLTTPIQVLVRTTKPDLDAYFSEAQNKLKNAPKQLREIFRDFMEFENDFIEKNSVRERNFYLVVTHQPPKGLTSKILGNPEKEAQKLDQRTRIIQEKLAACGLASKRLENVELVGFLASYSSQNATDDEVSKP